MNDDPTKELAAAQRHLTRYVVQLGRKRDYLLQELAKVEATLAEIHPLARSVIDRPVMPS
jgi:hypothetical protein